MTRAGWPRRSRRTTRSRGWCRRCSASATAIAALSSWQGGGPITAETLAQIDRGDRRPRPPAAPGARLGLSAARRRAARCVIMDAAPPPVARLVEGGCASTLAFELSDGPHRIVVNCGGARSVLAQVPQGAGRRAAHHRGAFDADRRRQQFDRDPRRRHARPRRRRGRARAAGSGERQPDRGEP